MGVIKENHLRIRFDARPENEALARMVVAAFIAEMNPTLEQLSDVKTAVSEAVTNAVVHAYKDEKSQIVMECHRLEERFTVTIVDCGVGIADVEMAMRPFFTTRGAQERTGMGFAFMEAFMDELQVKSKLGKGTSVRMTKLIEGESAC